MPRTKQQFDELRTQKRELIESAAIKCFAKNGFPNTSMNDIAKEAGISVGLTYNYYSSKVDLLKSIYIKGIQNVYAPLEIGKELNKQTFVGFVEHIFSEIEKNASFWRLYFIVISEPEILNQFQEYLIEAATPVINAVVQYFESQNLPNPEIEARLFFSTIDGVCINYLIDSSYPLGSVKQKVIANYA